MSCKNYNGCASGSMPINVAKTSDQKTCSTNCAYSFDYGLSSLQVTNNGDHLVFSYDGTIDVTYNGSQYNVEEVRLYKSSLNEYNGSYADAELIIHHTNTNGENLLVCIPIMTNSALSDSERLFSEIIHLAPSNANDIASINVPNYTLNSFVPKAAYYVYSGSLPYSPCSGSYEVILFDIQSAINMNSDDMNSLGSIICNQQKKLVNSIDDSKFFYNDKGTKDVVTDDIYIACNEVDDQGNIIEDGVPFPADGNNANLGSSMSDAEKEKWEKNLELYGGLVGGVIVMLGLGYGLKKIFEHMNSSE